MRAENAQLVGQKFFKNSSNIELLLFFKKNLTNKAFIVFLGISENQICLPKKQSVSNHQTLTTINACSSTLQICIDLILYFVFDAAWDANGLIIRSLRFEID